MKNLMHTLFLSCLKASELIEKKLHLKLSAKENLQLKIHKTMCKACTLYEEQSIFIEKGLKQQLKQQNHHIDTEKLKESILNKLK